MYSVYSKEFFAQKIKNVPLLAAEVTGNGKMKKRAAVLRLEKYLNSFIRGEKDIRLVIMYGLRGIGKTTMLFQLYYYLLNEKKIPQENVIYLSIDELSLQTDGETQSITYDVVKDYVEKYHQQALQTIDKKLFIFIDESHFDKKWAIAAKTIYDSSRNIFLIMTGSSAISLHLNTDTARRSIKEPIFPISFLEYGVISNNIFPKSGTADAIKQSTLSLEPASLSFLPTAHSYLVREFKEKGKDIETELNKYLTIGGFGFSFESTEERVYRRILDMIQRIITQDMPLVSNFDTKTYPDMWRILGALSIKTPGETSHNKLFRDLNLTSPTHVKNILDTMEKTQLLISVKPFPKDAGAKTNYPFKYYFSSPTILTALKYANGKTSRDEVDNGLLWETVIANSLFKITQTAGTPLNLFYDPIKEGNVDFLIVNPVSGKIIPIEVGGNKSKKQIKQAIINYESEYGVLITNHGIIKFEDKVLEIPLWFFLYS